MSFQISRFRNLSTGHRRRPFFTFVLVTALLGLAAPVAYAAAPSNDLFGGATPVTAIPFAETLDTTEATTDADDVSMNAACGAPATDASVWYAFTPATSGGVIVNVASSSYTAGVLVATGSPGNFSLVTCGPAAVTFATSAGTTYYLLAIDDQFDGGGNGGTLNISITEAPPPPTVEVTVDPVGTFNRSTGGATLTGTFTCSNADFMDMFGELTQQVGRFAVRGSFAFFSSGECDGTSHEWTAEVFPESGTSFAGGKSASVTFSIACNDITCGFGYTEQRVSLRGGK